MLCTVIAVLGAIGVPAAEAGPRGATDTVEGEILRRQNQIIEAERLIVEGDDFRTAGDYTSAARSYGQAYGGLSPSPLANDTIVIARERYAAASVRQAIELIDAAEFGKAHEVLDSVLHPDVHPSYQPALTVKSRLADPEFYNTTVTPEHLDNVEKVKDFLAKADGAMRIADYDLALDFYTKVLRIDRYNVAARRGQLEAEQQVINYHKSSRDQAKAKMLRQVDEAWETQVEISDSFGLSSLGGGGPVGGNLASRSVQQALSEIVLDRVQFDEATLDEVFEFLSRKSLQADPAGEGVNFVITLPPEDSAIRDRRVTLSLRNIPLLEVIKYVTGETGTTYRVNGFAVQIESLESGSRNLVTERFRVPPDFLSTVSADGGGGGDDPFAEIDASSGGLNLRRLSAQEFLSNQGVTFPEGASATFLPASSTLLLRNTPANIQLVRAVIDSSFSDVPKQVEIHVTMMDISHDELNELGFDWLLGQFNSPGSDRVFGGGGTLGNSPTSGSAAAGSAEYPFIPPGGNTPLGNNPLTSGLRSGRQWNEGDSINNILLGTGESVLSNPSSFKTPGIFGVGGVLTDPQFQFVMRGLSQMKGGDLINRPSVITRSGQRATVDVIREFPYATEYDPPEIPQDTGIDFNDGTSAQSSGAIPVTPAHPAAFEVRNLGTHLEVEPVVAADNYTVELNLAPELVRFEGFINYGSPITTTSTDVLGGSTALQLTDNRILQPVFKTLRTNTQVTVWDGQTLVFGGLIEDRSTRVEDKTPILGDAPLIGRFFRSNGEQRSMRAVVFFVKVHVIDPSGKRINVREADADAAPFVGRR